MQHLFFLLAGRGASVDGLNRNLRSFQLTINSQIGGVRSHARWILSPASVLAVRMMIDASKGKQTRFGTHIYNIDPINAL